MRILASGLVLIWQFIDVEIFWHEGVSDKNVWLRIRPMISVALRNQLQKHKESTDCLKIV